ESAARFFVGLVKQRVPDVWERPNVREMVRFLDWSEYGGAPLLGVQRIVVVCHGSSNARAVRNAVRSVKEFSVHHASQRIERGISETNAREYAEAAGGK
ncbi:MAG TPA: hypothetical protein VD861_03400, partial [Pyrinomonadaceae bacterium]|nr:hypothetical protein [Pyrinomonadaceae bacterium]